MLIQFNVYGMWYSYFMEKILSFKQYTEGPEYYISENCNKN